MLAIALVVVFALFPASGEFEDAQENEATSFLPGDAESVKALKAIEQFPDGQVAAAVDGDRARRRDHAGGHRQGGASSSRA